MENYSGNSMRDEYALRKDTMIGNSRKKHSKSLAEDAYHTLRNRIMQGGIHPGAAMLEEHISASLEMSRTPVRTALTRLKAEGLLVEGADRTLRVPDLDAKSIADTFRARITIEAAVAALAAEQATAEQIQRLEHIMWDEEMAHQNRDESLVCGLDRMFHTYLAEIADNSYFIEFSSHTTARSSLMLSQSRTLQDAIIPAMVEHRRIVDAIKQHDPVAAKAAMEDHLSKVCDRIKSTIDMGK